MGEFRSLQDPLADMGNEAVAEGLADFWEESAWLSTLDWLKVLWRLQRLSRATSRAEAGSSSSSRSSSCSGANDSLLVRFFFPARCFLRRPALRFEDEAASPGAGESTGFAARAELLDWPWGVEESREKGLLVIVTVALRRSDGRRACVATEATCGERTERGS